MNAEELTKCINDYCGGEVATASLNRFTDVVSLKELDYRFTFAKDGGVIFTGDFVTFKCQEKEISYTENECITIDSEGSIFMFDLDQYKKMLRAKGIIKTRSYRVDVQRTYTKTFYVEAASEGEARELIEKRACEDDSYLDYDSDEDDFEESMFVEEE